jgi:hypothetical protein
MDSAGAPLNSGLDYIQNDNDTKRLEVRLFGLDALNPQHIEVVSRAPVNVNSASEEVLVSLLTGLQGFFVTDRRRNNPRWSGDLYLSFKMQLRYYAEQNSRGDEIGYLVEQELGSRPDEHSEGQDAEDQHGADHLGVKYGEGRLSWTRRTLAIAPGPIRQWSAERPHWLRQPAPSSGVQGP